jgi:hypothetical protein
VKPALAVASALACGLLLPLGTGAIVWLWLLLGWVVLSVPVSLLAGRLLKRRGRD